MMRFLILTVILRSAQAQTPSEAPTSVPTTVPTSLPTFVPTVAAPSCPEESGGKSVCSGGVTVKVKGQSGKMTLTVPKAGGGTQNVEIEMDALRQVDSSGATLGGGGSQKHSFNSFATQSFTFSSPTPTVYGGVPAQQIAFESVLVGTSKVKIYTYVFTAKGNITVGNYSTAVTTGTVKFNVELGNWAWCGDSGVSCNKNGVGAAVELDLIMAAKGAIPSKKGGSSTTFDLGGGATMDVLSTYSEDNGTTWKTMPPGYPLVSGSKFTLKFPKWSGSAVLYDPTLSSPPATTSVPTTISSVAPTATPTAAPSSARAAQPTPAPTIAPGTQPVSAAKRLVPMIACMLTSLAVFMAL